MVRLLLVMINPLYCISSVEVIFYFDTDILTSTSVRDLPNCSDRVFLDEGKDESVIHTSFPRSSRFLALVISPVRSLFQNVPNG